MKSSTKILAALALVLALALVPLAACGGQTADNGDATGTEDAATAVDISGWKILADAYAATEESKASGYDDTYYVTVLAGNDRYYRVVAEADTAVLDQTNELDFFAEDYNEQYNAIVGALNIISAEDITDQLIAENDPAYVGKTGQELIDAGFVFVGYMGYGGDETYGTFDKDSFEYEITFGVSISDDTDEGAAIMDVPSTAIQMVSASDAATNPELVK